MDNIQILYWIIALAFLGLALNNIRNALLMYLPLKLFLLKPMVLFYAENIPLITLDRFIYFELLLVSLVVAIKKRDFLLMRLKKFPYKVEFAVVLIASLITFFMGDASLKEQAQHLVSFLVEYILFAVLLWVILYRNSDVVRLMHFFAVCFAIIGVYGLLSKVFQSNPYIDFFVAKAKAINNDNLIFTYKSGSRFGITGRIQSVFFHPIAYSGFLALTIPFIYNFYLKKVFNKRSIIYLLVVYSLALNIIYANSRTGLLTYAFISFSSFFLFVNSKDQRRKFFISIYILMGIGLFFLPKAADGFLFLRKSLLFWEPINAFDGSTLSDRFIKLSYSLEAVKDNWLFGNGFGTTESIVMQNNTALGGAESVWYHHIIDTGLIGVLATLFFYISIITKLVKAYFRSVKNSSKVTSSMSLLFTVAGYLLFITATGELLTSWYFLTILICGSQYTGVNSSQWRIGN